MLPRMDVINLMTFVMVVLPGLPYFTAYKTHFFDQKSQPKVGGGSYSLYASFKNIFWGTGGRLK